MLVGKNIHSYSNLTVAAIHAALAAGDFLKRGFGTHFKVSSKAGIHDVVTEYDLGAENIIISFLQKEDPASSFLAEETGIHKGVEGGIEWVIDPLDGTLNFSRGIPHFAVSIAAREKNSIILGVIYNPTNNELFVAEKGKGAFLNGQKISVSNIFKEEESLLATGFPFNVKSDPDFCIEHFMYIIHKGVPIRRMGAASLDLAYVAAGRFDAYWETSLGPWDIAAGSLLVEEAKGTVSHWNNSPLELKKKNNILASNGLLHKHLINLLKKI